MCHWVEGVSELCFGCSDHLSDYIYLSLGDRALGTVPLHSTTGLVKAHDTSSKEVSLLWHDIMFPLIHSFNH